MPRSTPAARLRLAFELLDLGERMMRARLSREHPEWTKAQVQVAIEEWLRQRPGRGVVGAKCGASADAVSGWASLTGPT